MERYEISENEVNFIITDNKIGLDCLIIPKEAYKDPKAVAEGYKELIEIATRWKGKPIEI